MTQLHKLSNGLEIVLEENRSAPVISFYTLVKAGSAVERPDEGGICHVIEHMLFKGTPSRAVGEIAKDVENAGGEINAFTSFDQTVYYINMASRFAQKGLAILADVLKNPLFDEKELEREKEVILEEIRREKDDPSHRASELLFTKSYTRHPYKNPIIGREKTVKSFTRKKVLGFYRKWYTPANMALIVVGDFEEKAMLRKVKNGFAGFAGSPPPAVKYEPESRHTAVNVYIEENPVFSSYFTLGFHIPEITHADVPALDVLSHILAGSDSARLTQELREKLRLVNDVSSYAFAPKDPGLFIINSLAAPEKTARAVTAMWNEIEKLRVRPVKPGELARAKLVITSNEVYEKETTSGQASKYAYFIATAGTHLFEQKYYQQLSGVTADDIMRVVKKYLTAGNATLAMVVPKDVGINTARIKKSMGKICRPKRERPASGITVRRLGNGITLAVRENRSLPIVAVCAACHGGLRFENRRTNGITNLAAQTIIKGTKNLSALEVAEKCETISGAVDSFSGRNSFGLRAEFLSDKIEDGFALFSEILSEPAFSGREITAEKLQALDAIKNQEDALSSLAYIKFLSTLFPNHPYGMRILGEKASVKSFTRADVLRCYKKIVTAENMVIAVSGDVSAGDVVRLAEKNLRIGRGGGQLTPPAPQTPPKKPAVTEYLRPEKEQAHIVMGFLGPTLKTKDHYAFSVINNLFAGQGGRLFMALRDRLGLAYAVSSTFFSGIEPGYFAGYISTHPYKTGRAIEGLRKEFCLLAEKEVSAPELARAKNHIIGTYELDKQRNASVAGSMAFNILYGLGVNEIEDYPRKISAVTREDILKTARKYFTRPPVTAIIKPTS